MTNVQLLEGIGANARRYRNAAGLSQSELAKVLDVSTQWVSEVERGNGTASLDYLLKLAEALGTSVHTLVPQADKGEGATIHDEIGALVAEAPAEVLVGVRDLLRALRSKR